MRLGCVAVLFFSLTAAHMQAASGQGTAADYERADTLAARVQGKVYKERVNPHWFAGNDRFWYRNGLPGGACEFILVDAVHATRAPAFDHKRLAQAMREVGMDDARPERLPINSLVFDSAGHGLTFRAGNRSWHCDLETYVLRELSPAPDISAATPPARLGTGSSRRTGAETWLTFVNRTQDEVELFWLDSAGRRHSYGKLAPGAQHRQHSYAGHVWLVTNNTGTVLESFEAEEQSSVAEIDGHPAGGSVASEVAAPRRFGPRGVSPDGRWRAAVKNHNLMLVDSRSGEEFQLSRDGRYGDAYDEVYWSFDSAWMVAMRTKRGQDRTVHVIESSPRDQVQPRLHSFSYLKPGDEITFSKPHLFDIAARKEIPISDALFPNPWSIEDVRWARDSSRFTFLYNQRGHQALRIVSVDARSGAARAVVNEESPTFIDYSGKLYVHYLDATGEIIWASERDGWNHLYLYDSLTGEVKQQITRGAWLVRGVERVDAEQRQIWFRAGGMHPEQDPYQVHFCRINFDGSGLVMLTEGDGTHEVQYSPDGRFYLDHYSRVDLPPVTELRRTSDGTLVCVLEQANWSELLATGWQVPERFVAKGRDGTTDIYGVIYRPTMFDPQQKYPIIEDIYAGPQGSFVPKQFAAFHDPQSLAELGFIVVQIDGMGTSDRSKAFHDVCWKNLGDSGFPDRILWIKAAAAKYPYLDTSRVGIYGTSAGGQSALRAVLARAEFYHAAVSACGCHDNRMDKIWWNEQWMGWPVGAHYAEQSNVTHAHRLRGKLLLIVGELDHNVDPASTMQVANALIQAGKDFDLLVVPGADHGFGGSYGIRRMRDFFVRHLLRVEPPERNAGG